MTETVVVAHGLWMPGVEMTLLRRRLQQAGFRTELFRFPTVRATLSQNVRSLARFVEGVAGEKIHVVGYSLGGVVALTLLGGVRLPRIGRIVCLGSPLTGSRVADHFSQWGFGRAIVGRSLTEHSEQGGIAHWDGRHELGIIAGTRSLGIGRFVGSVRGENDGTVAVDETRLPGAKAHMTLPVTHTQLLFDRAVARQTVHFLRHGQFAFD